MWQPVVIALIAVRSASQHSLRIMSRRLSASSSALHPVPSDSDLQAKEAEGEGDGDVQKYSDVNTEGKRGEEGGAKEEEYAEGYHGVDMRGKEREGEGDSVVIARRSDVVRVTAPCTKGGGGMKAEVGPPCPHVQEEEKERGGCEKGAGSAVERGKGRRAGAAGGRDEAAGLTATRRSSSVRGASVNGDTSKADNITGNRHNSNTRSEMDHSKTGPAGRSVLDAASSAAMPGSADPLCAVDERDSEEEEDQAGIIDQRFDGEMGMSHSGDQGGQQGKHVRWREAVEGAVDGDDGLTAAQGGSPGNRSEGLEEGRIEVHARDVEPRQSATGAVLRLGPSHEGSDEQREEGAEGGGSAAVAGASEPVKYSANVRERELVGRERAQPWAIDVSEEGAGRTAGPDAAPDTPCRNQTHDLNNVEQGKRRWGLWRGGNGGRGGGRHKEADVALSRAVSREESGSLSCQRSIGGGEAPANEIAALEEADWDMGVTIGAKEERMLLRQMSRRDRRNMMWFTLRMVFKKIVSNPNNPAALLGVAFSLLSFG